MQDVQNQTDQRQIDIDRVGIRDLAYPLAVLDRQNGKQHVRATIEMSVDLPHHFKGTHMSRFVEIINDFRELLSLDKVHRLLLAMQERLQADTANFTMQFTYFIEKLAPVSKKASLMPYEVTFSSSLKKSDFDFILALNVPVTTLCPCSKEISNYGAHNQRSFVKVSVRYNDFIWLEEIIAWVEACASAELYPLLKRPDEKYVTEHAYNHPQFVEDVVRDVALKLNGEERVRWFRVAAENHESIHAHNAFAVIERDKRQKDA
jgi:GTP cyclohydrolase I